MRRRGVLLISFVGSPLALLAVGWLVGLRLNLTGSLPVGLYLASRTTLVRGVIVLTCLPPDVAAFAKARGYVPAGGGCPGGVVPVGKPILAIQGDTITVTLRGLLVNRVLVPNSQPLELDRKGRPLPRLSVGTYVVAPGELWVLSPHSRFSFDSRYFGAVQAAQVRASLRNLWTVGSQTSARRASPRRRG
jgi:conjugative transfer signal peptidase TraF